MLLMQARCRCRLRSTSRNSLASLHTPFHRSATSTKARPCSVSSTVHPLPCSISG